jgi:hypothetical protein
MAEAGEEGGVMRRWKGCSEPQIDFGALAVGLAAFRRQHTASERAPLLLSVAEDKNTTGMDGGKGSCLRSISSLLARPPPASTRQSSS